MAPAPERTPKDCSGSNPSQCNPSQSSSSTLLSGKKRKSVFDHDERGRERINMLTEEYRKRTKAWRDKTRTKIQRAISARSIKEFYPSATLHLNTITIPGVSSQTYELLRELVPTFTQLSLIPYKIGYQKKPRKGTLTIAMPGALHEVLAKFAVHIKEQLRGSTFVGDGLYKKHHIEDLGSPTLSLENGGRPEKREPDAAVAFAYSRNRYPFLILEVAICQPEGEVRKKAQDWIRGSRGAVGLVMVIMREKNKARPSDSFESLPSSDRSTAASVTSSQNPPSSLSVDHGSAAAAAVTSSQSLPSSPPQLVAQDIPESSNTASMQNIPPLPPTSSGRAPTPTYDSTLIETLGFEPHLGPYDRIVVSVYRSIITNELANYTGKLVLDKVEVYPTQPSEQVTIDWSDMSNKAWAETARMGGLSQDTPAPSCNVSLAPLTNLVKKFLGTDQDDDLPDYLTSGRRIPSGLQWKSFLPRSSPQEEPSSSGPEITSSAERAQDPDYVPAPNSSGESQAEDKD